MDDFFPTNDFSLLESRQLYRIAKYKASNCCKIEAKIEAVIQRYSVKKVFLKNREIHRKTPMSESFLIKLQL